MSIRNIESFHQNFLGPLPEDAFSHILSFVNSTQLLNVQKVCRSWSEFIGHSDQSVWKEQCRMQGHRFRNLEVEEALGLCGFAPHLLKIIAAYVSNEPTTNMYKEMALSVCGEVQLQSGIFKLYCQSRAGDPISIAGDDPNKELYVPTPVRNFESTSREESSIMQVHLDWVGTWQVVPPQRLSWFPYNLPLRFFFNRDKTFKKAGDRIKIRFPDMPPVILTCVYQPEWTEFPWVVGRKLIPTFEAGLDKRVQGIIASHPQAQVLVDKAKTAASISGDWLS